MSDQVKAPPAPMRSFEQSLPMALLQAREMAMQLFRPLLADHDLTEQQWRVLRALSAEPEPVEVAPLAERTSLLAPSLTRILTNLEGRGLIEREAVVHDQRRATISLSLAGAELVRLIAPRSEATYNEIEAAFGRRRLAHLLAELHDLAALAVESPAPSPSREEPK